MKNNIVELLNNIKIIKPILSNNFNKNYYNINDYIDINDIFNIITNKLNNFITDNKNLFFNNLDNDIKNDIIIEIDNIKESINKKINCNFDNFFIMANYKMICFINNNSVLKIRKYVNSNFKYIINDNLDNEIIIGKEIKYQKNKGIFYFYNNKNGKFNFYISDSMKDYLKKITININENFNNKLKIFNIKKEETLTIKHNTDLNLINEILFDYIINNIKIYNPDKIVLNPKIISLFEKSKHFKNNNNIFCSNDYNFKYNLGKFHDIDILIDPLLDVNLNKIHFKKNNFIIFSINIVDYNNLLK